MRRRSLYRDLPENIHVFSSKLEKHVFFRAPPVHLLVVGHVVHFFLFGFQISVIEFLCFDLDRNAL